MKHLNVYFLTLSLALLPLSVAYAGGHAEEEPMTLNDCLIYARDHAHVNRINRLEVEAAAADRGICVSDLMPHMSFGSSGSLSFGRNIDPETNTYDNKRTLGTGFGLELSLPLFDGLVRINNLKVSEAAGLRKRHAMLAEQDRISLEVIRNFYNITYCEALVEQVESQLRRDSTDLAASRRSFELGTKSGADVAELEAIVAADRYELVNQQNLLKKANLSLRISMGMPPSDIPLSLISGLTPDTVARHTGILPEILEAESAVREERLNLRAAKGGYFPTISFNAGVSTSYFRMMGIRGDAPSFSRQFRDNLGEYLGLSFSFPLFDGLATRNRVRKAVVRLRESEVRLEQTRYKVSQATEEARIDLESAVEELSSARTRLEAERIANKAMRRKFELGAASAIDLYTTSSRLAVAEANLVGKRIQRIVAEITLRYYQGYPLICER